jgi:hypothetical protein
MEATSTSPVATPDGRGTDNVDPTVVAVAMAPRVGRRLTARPDPVAATVIPRTSVSSIRW